MAKRAARKSTDVLPLPKDGPGSLAYFLQEIEGSEDKMREVIPEWKEDLASYEGVKAKLNGFNDADVVNVNVGFYTAEGKGPNLFYTTPFIQAEAQMSETKQAVSMVQAIINKMLSRDGVHAIATMDEVIKDLLITAGIGPTKVGYECVRKDVIVPTGRMIPNPDPMVPPFDPLTRQPNVIPATNEDGSPETKTESRMIFSRFYFNRISPANIRIPLGFTGSRYDQAPMIGWTFPLPERVAKERGVEIGGVSAMVDDLSLLKGKDADAMRDVPMAIEIWYRAYLFDPTVLNPELIRQLVIAPGKRKNGKEGKAEVLVHRDSPWQVFNEDGKFIGGMRGYPIHIFTIRGRPESAYPQSDARVLRDVAQEKSSGRTLQVMQRRRNLPMVAADKSRVNKDTLDQIEKGGVQRIILTDGDPSEILAPLDRSSYPPENDLFDRRAQEDIDRLSAAGANQQSLPNSGSDTATEATYIQRAYDNRLSKERERILEDYQCVVEKLFALLQLFADEEQVIEVVGADKAKQLMTWDKTKIQGRFGFKLKPDSSERTNAAEDRELFLRLFNLIANAPGVNTLELIRLVVEKFDVNPTDIVAEKLPEPPPVNKVNLSVNINPSIDLNPMNPNFGMVVALLKACGVELPPAAAPEPGQQDPITSPEGVPPVNKHDANLTGNMSGPGPI